MFKVAKVIFFGELPPFFVRTYGATRSITIIKKSSAFFKNGGSSLKQNPLSFYYSKALIVLLLSRFPVLNP